MNSKIASRLLGCLRVVGLASSMLALVGGLGARRAEAHFAEVLRGFGDRLAGMPGFLLGSSPRKLFINGIELHAVTVTTALSVDETLTRLQSMCHPVGEVDVPSTLVRRLSDSGSPSLPISAGVLRQQTRNEGVLGCLDMGERPSGQTLLARLIELGKTGDLKSLGNLRYGLARRRGDLTTVLMFWSEGPLRLSGQFPNDGDAPGSDLPGVPRPNDARRLLSATEEGKPSGLAFYAVKDGPTVGDVRAAYVRHLEAEGWSTKAARAGNLVAQKGGRTLIVRVRQTVRKQVVTEISDLG